MNAATHQPQHNPLLEVSPIMVIGLRTMTLQGYRPQEIRRALDEILTDFPNDNGFGPQEALATCSPG